MISHVLVEDGKLAATTGEAIDLPWWSLTKTVIAAAALVLVRDGKLSLDDPLAGQGYTLRQLLQHRAGVRNYGGLPAYHEAVSRHEPAWPVEVLLQRAEADRPLYPPGEGWAYSNIGYLFVRQLIERVTGAALGQALDRLVLSPLGIAGVRIATQWGELAPDYDPGWVYHGSLVGPLPQAALLLHRLMIGELLRPDLLEGMLRGHPVDGVEAGRPWVTTAYGLGVMTGTIAGGVRVVGHTGGGPGSVIAAYHAPARRRTAAAFAPGNDEDAVEQTCVTVLTSGG